MPDSTPNYLSVNPATGDVSAIFAGGVQMLEEVLSTALPPPASARQLKWVRETDGARAGFIYVNRPPPAANPAIPHTMYIDQVHPDNPDPINPNNQSEISLSTVRAAAATDDHAEINLLVKTRNLQQNRRLISENGISDFIQTSMVQVWDGSPTTQVLTIPYAWTSVVGICRSTGFSNAVVLQPYAVRLDGTSVGSADFLFNTVNEHTSLTTIVRANLGAHAAGNVTMAIDYPTFPSLNYDANDRFGGCLLFF